MALQWVKSKEDREQQADILREHAKSLAEDLPKFKRIKAAAGKVHDDLMAVIPMGDPHFGMYAWVDECGDSFDL
ncbi:MAG: oxidoreductase, partial [Candidatus Aminicenantes bacterium]